MTGKLKAEGERIAKYLARAGVASRREVERMIAAGRIAIDGDKLDTPAVKVTGAERITVDGAEVAAPEPPRLWRYHKNTGVLTTHRDPQGRPTVFDALPKGLGHVIAVGRLDKNSQGLLLLTNSGGLARWMELPATGWTRRYRVRAYGRPNDKMLGRLARGVTVEGVRYGPIEATIERQMGANAWLIVALREGKNREVRRALEYIGLTVNRLIRISYGPFHLGSLPPGELKEMPSHVIREQVGVALQEFEPGAAKPRRKR